MTVPVFTQNVITVIWDFDKTLIPGNMQKPLFEHYEVDEPKFWDEANGLAEFYASQGHELISVDTMYLNHVLTYVEADRFKGLDNALLRKLGEKLVFYPGMPTFMADLRGIVDGDEEFRRHEITLEHYIISTGFRQTILGSAVAKHVEGVWGCEFIETVAPPDYLDDPPPVADNPVVTAVGYSIDNTTKTRAIFEINKGVNKFPEEIDVNATIAHEDRRVPFENMIYIADGPSDVPVFSILNQYGGRTLAVYNPQPEKFAEFKQVASLAAQSRVQAIGPADYNNGSHTTNWLRLWVTEIAEAIVARHERRLRESVSRAPRHLPERRTPEVEGPVESIERSPAARVAVEPSPEPNALEAKNKPAAPPRRRHVGLSGNKASARNSEARGSSKSSGQKSKGARSSRSGSVGRKPRGGAAKP